jgi:hypothetical protein
MQLIQIGVQNQKTVRDLVLEMAERQSAEIDQVKLSVAERSARKRDRCGRKRCDAPSRGR